MAAAAPAVERGCSAHCAYRDKVSSHGIILLRTPSLRPPPGQVLRKPAELRPYQAALTGGLVSLQAALAAGNTDVAEQLLVVLVQVGPEAGRRGKRGVA